MAAVALQILLALLIAALSLPVAYVITTLILSLVHEGYVMVDPVRLRRISLILAVLVFVGTFLAQRLA